MSVGQSTDAALVKEVDILNEQAEERNNDLQVVKKEKLMNESWVNMYMQKQQQYELMYIWRTETMSTGGSIRGKKILTIRIPS